MTTSVEIVDSRQSDLDRFIEKARVAAAVVTDVGTFQEAIDYTLNLCGSRGACRLKVSGCEEQLSPGAEELCQAKQEKIIAAPELTPAEFEMLAGGCDDSGFSCINSGMRSQLAGVDIGFTHANLGIAETGTLVLNCPGEELRLATMVCEYHVCVLSKSKIVKDAFEAEEQMRQFMNETPNYTAFITGPSRTADIERVLTIGVHGPLELHILLVED
jgi:L-lactate dehydrogenase complex protein LldG